MQKEKHVKWSSSLFELSLQVNLFLNFKSNSKSIRKKTKASDELQNGQHNTNCRGHSKFLHDPGRHRTTANPTPGVLLQDTGQHIRIQMAHLCRARL